MKHFLREIVNQKRKDVEALKIKLPMTHFLRSKRLHRDVRDFKARISGSDGINLIAEIKKKSPSRKKGFLRRLDVAHLSRIYATSGAKAISVLTDARFFGGDISHINQVKRAIKLPVLRKDFIVDGYQIYESRYFGADAILLIARILSTQEIKSFMHLAGKIGMASVVEVHDEKDLEKALVAGAKIIGINNRDLDTFKVDIKNTFKLAPKMPNEILKISESGIRSNDDILRLRRLGINAVLIGSSFLEAKDIGSKVKEIIGRE